MYKFSKFNFIHEKNNDELLLYNSLQGINSFYKIKKDDKEDFYNIKNNIVANKEKSLTKKLIE
ncbi:MAG: hypothetical protein RR887_11230, partial [Niameybacter sp.]